MTVMNNALTSVLLAALCVFAQPGAAHSAVQELDFGEYGVLSIDIPDQFIWEHTIQKLGYVYRSQLSNKETLSIALSATKPSNLTDMPDEEFLEGLLGEIVTKELPPGFTVEKHHGNRLAVVVIVDITTTAKSFGMAEGEATWVMWVSMLYYDTVFTAMMTTPDNPEQARDRLLDIMWNAEHWVEQ